LDGFGCSHFPNWFSFGVSDLGARVEAVRSAAGAKPAWVSELQAGGARNGFGVLPPVDPSAQQRWVWSCYGRGIKAVLFWCWRDEVFGPEASGFGLAGSDGGADARLSKMAHTGELARSNEALLLGYRPDPAEIGVLFSPASYQLFWADKGNLVPNDATDSTRGWLTALERAQLPYDVVDAARPAGLVGLKVMVLPWALVVPPAMGQALADWVRSGGTLITEAELDAYDELGFYRYPSDRPLAVSLGLSSLGRREPGEPMDVVLAPGALRMRLRPASWVEALAAEGGEVLARSSSGDVVAMRRRVGKGQVLALGSFPGLSYVRDRYADLERFVGDVADRAGVVPSFRAEPHDGEVLQWRSGLSGGSRLLFLTSEDGPRRATVYVRPDLLSSTNRVGSLIGQVSLGPPNDGWARLDVELSEDGTGLVSW
jgi:beta-galactosidase